MHDLDRTQAETWMRDGEFEIGYEGEAGYEFESDPEYYGEMYGEVYAEGVLNEADEMELAAELLEVADEAELDQFLGKLISRVGRAVGRVIPRPVFGALGGVLKGLARKALPVVGGALGSMVAPGIGTAAGGALASAAGRMFGLELEGMSAEDQEFEVARRYVRLATEAAKQAALAPPVGTPASMAQQAVAAAAQQHAPGLMAGAAPAVAGGPPRRLPRSGRWIRRGRSIVLLNAY